MLTHQVALVTGSGRGIGRAIALAFAQTGWAVVVNDIDAASAEAVAREIGEQGGQSLAYAADVSDSTEVTAMFHHVADRWGRLDALVNNAGIEPRASILDMDVAEWD
ncbi:MAG: SDR family NAD(P)-dependent oxidoreductase, partial [Anaerolineae bacterium]|nr:SDR family NAD(P)-dependent oxidoreductase [Anaerolineae bacterium]